MAAQTYKVLAQSNPSATTLTDIYTVPANTTAVISSIVITNRSTATSYRISIGVAGAADDNKQYLAYGVAIADNAVHERKDGITMAATDVLRVYATLATLSFSVFGVENS